MRKSFQVSVLPNRVQRKKMLEIRFVSWRQCDGWHSVGVLGVIAAWNLTNLELWGAINAVFQGGRCGALADRASLLVNVLRLLDVLPRHGGCTLGSILSHLSEFTR